MLKGLRASVILRNPQCKDVNAQFTTLPLTSLCDQLNELDLNVDKIKT